MKLQSTSHFLSFILLSTLSACQVAPLGKNDLFSTGYTSSRSVTQRTCWQQLSPRHRESPRTFLLAAAANVGELKLTHRDAQQFTNSMQSRYQIPHDQICLMTEVYRTEFEQALSKLAQVVNNQDRVIIFFSGHGSYVRDDNGDESDQLDDVLVPLDVNDLEMPRRQEVIVDDQLVQLVNALPTATVLTFIDACYAGGMYMGTAWTLNQPRLKFFAKGEVGTLPPPLSIASGSNRGGLASLQGVMFAATQEYQKAWEDPNQGGVFTTCFLQELQRYSQANLSQIFRATLAKMPSCNQTNEIQSPEMKGNLNLATYL
ncbi:MAG: caspase family protein [Thioploca sp.]|nr:caspase family protein [Thioploca sp.]